jgi:hypothetical protein
MEENIYITGAGTGGLSLGLLLQRKVLTLLGNASRLKPVILLVSPYKSIILILILILTKRRSTIKIIAGHIQFKKKQGESIKIIALINNQPIRYQAKLSCFPNKCAGAMNFKLPMQIFPMGFDGTFADA